MVRSKEKRWSDPKRLVDCTHQHTLPSGWDLFETATIRWAGWMMWTLIGLLIGFGFTVFTLPLDPRLLGPAAAIFVVGCLLVCVTGLVNPMRPARLRPCSEPERPSGRRSWQPAALGMKQHDDRL